MGVICEQLISKTIAVAMTLVWPPPGSLLKMLTEKRPQTAPSQRPACQASKPQVGLRALR
jgi:hypothetical protein